MESSSPVPPPLPRTPPPLPLTQSERGGALGRFPPPHAFCRFCHGPIHPGASKCLHCGEFLTTSHSNGIAGCLGFFLGPVGLWYKGQWAAGFAWITVTILVVLATAGVGVIFAPFFWLGIAIHAYAATPKR